MGLTVGQDGPHHGTCQGSLKSSFEPGATFQVAPCSSHEQLNQEHQCLLSISKLAFCVCSEGQCLGGEKR